MQRLQLKDIQERMQILHNTTNTLENRPPEMIPDPESTTHHLIVNTEENQVKTAVTPKTKRNNLLCNY